MKRTLVIFAVLLAGYVAAVLQPLAEPVREGLVLVPFLSVYFFHHLGVPGLLEHNGLCGWGWCSPTVFGWGFLAGFWLALAWLLAWGIARLTARRP